MSVIEQELAALTRQLEELNRIGAALSAERDTKRLLELILTKAREITCADAGSLYLVEKGEEEPRHLRFTYAQNDSVSWPFRESVLELSECSIAGGVALTGRPINLPDVYALPPSSPYSFNRAFDDAAGYRTKSMLTVPMRTPPGDIIGVLQLINAKRDASEKLTSSEVIEANVVPFTAQQESLVTSLASQAAVALENSLLYDAIRQLFEGFVRASIVAIEARDPTTSGHSFRVANLTVALAETVDRADDGPFSSVRFSRDEMRTIRYASLLHDFGKVGVREEVLVKAKKLQPAQLELVRERFRLARRSREVDSLQKRLALLLTEGRERYLQQLPGFDTELLEQLAELDRYLATVESANEPSIMAEGNFERLRDIAAITFSDTGGATRRLLGDEDVRLLSIRKGSLSDVERGQIESHVLHTYRFLSQIPWTPEIREIPAIAVGHHEKLNGTGYPHKLSAPEIPIQTRMMTIADIFDALSASDRPYKKAVPIDRALDILELAVVDGEIDGNLFRTFVDGRVFEKWKTEPRPY
jgi:HD-GYP domain-containing protein (c-di-GMP phosphodiesterase class II)